MTAKRLADQIREATEGRATVSSERDALVVTMKTGQTLRELRIYAVEPPASVSSSWRWSSAGPEQAANSDGRGVGDLECLTALIRH